MRADYDGWLIDSRRPGRVDVPENEIRYIVSIVTSNRSFYIVSWNILAAFYSCTGRGSLGNFILNFPTAAGGL